MLILRGLLNVVLFFLALLVTAAITHDAWTWFLVPLGVPPINYLHSLGLTTFVAYWTQLGVAVQLVFLSEHLQQKSKSYLYTWGIQQFVKGAMWLSMYLCYLFMQ